MSTPDSVAGPLGGHQLPPLFDRFLAVVQAPSLDAELAAGIRPSASPAHRLRAEHLQRPGVRRRISETLNAAVESATSPRRYEPARAPLDREAIRRSRGEIRALADLVATAENPRTQGVAIAFQLAFDGSAALFRPRTPSGVERLASTVRAAHEALRVSGDFDDLGP